MSSNLFYSCPLAFHCCMLCSSAVKWMSYSRSTSHGLSQKAGITSHLWNEKISRKIGFTSFFFFLLDFKCKNLSNHPPQFIMVHDHPCKAFSCLISAYSCFIIFSFHLQHWHSDLCLDMNGPLKFLILFYECMCFKSVLFNSSYFCWPIFHTGLFLSSFHVPLHTPS